MRCRNGGDTLLPARSTFTLYLFQCPYQLNKWGASSGYNYSSKISLSISVIFIFIFVYILDTFFIQNQGDFLMNKRSTIRITIRDSNVRCAFSYKSITLYTKRKTRRLRYSYILNRL